MAEKKVKEKTKKGTNNKSKNIKVTKGKEEKKVKNSIINKNTIIALVIGIALGLLVMLLFMPDRIATLENGEQVIVTLGDKKITANQLYTDMKEYFSVNVLLDEIDNIILNDLYPEDNEMKTKVNEMADYYISMYETYYGYNENEFLEVNNFKTRDEFIDALTLEYRRDKCYDDYAKSLVTEKEINKYYETSVYGDIKTKYISVTGTDDDAKSLTSRIINRLNNGESYDSIVEHYKDRITVKDLDYVSFDNELDKTYIDALLSLSDNSYTKEAVKSSTDYEIIFRGDSKDKPSLEDVKEKIITILANQKKDADSTLAYKSLIEMRKENNVSIKDTDLAKKYEDYIKLYTSNDKND